MSYIKSKIVHKFLTSKMSLDPYEFFHLYYLNEKQALPSLINIEIKKNPYLEIQNTDTIVSEHMLSVLANNVSGNYPNEYRSCNYAYNYLFDLDEKSAGTGYKGLAISLQLDELINDFVLLQLSDGADINKIKKITFNQMMQHKIFSKIHNENKYGIDIFVEICECFKHLIIIIDNILTLNFFLKEPIDLDSLKSVEVIKLWFAGQKQNSKVWFELLKQRLFVSNILKANHSNFIELISQKIKRLDIDFDTKSFKYVEGKIFTYLNL